MKIGFIGFGEAAYHIASNILKNNVDQTIAIMAYDKMSVTDAAISPLIQERAKKANVQLVDSLEQLINNNKFVISATSSHVSIQVAEESATHLTNENIFVDLNSSSPE